MYKSVRDEMNTRLEDIQKKKLSAPDMPLPEGVVILGVITDTHLQALLLLDWEIKAELQQVTHERERRSELNIIPVPGRAGPLVVTRPIPELDQRMAQLDDLASVTSALARAELRRQFPSLASNPGFGIHIGASWEVGSQQVITINLSMLGET